MVRFSIVRITLLPQNKTITISGEMRVSVLLKKLSLLPSTVMVIRHDQLLTEDDLVEDDDEIEIRSVISGGL
ncbi:MAG: thiamine biosynthesis protein ThiS [Candidatus Binatia bacterium]|nr:thiamine biosynthesis protein ThiS [Candidatus Binatia bacterium]